MKPREEKVSKYFQSHCKWERPDGLDKAFWEWSTGWEASGRGTCQHKGVWEYEAKLPENATQKNHGWQQFVLRFVSLRTCAVGLQFYFWVHRDKKLVFLQKQQNQICIVSAPAMFPQHCYKTPLRVSAVMREKKLILQDRRYGWSSHICHCSSPTDWISIKSLDMKKKNIWLLRAEALREWLKCILDTHRTPCDALLPLAHADALFQGGAFLKHQIPAAVRIPGPHTGTDGERERADAHRDIEVHGNINQLKEDKRRAEVMRSYNEKSNFPLWKHTVCFNTENFLPSQKNTIYWH